MQSDALYLHVYQKILEGIRSFEYDENSPLPAERVICEKYHVSRATVRRALDKLKAEGYIYTLPNNGSFVRPQVFEQPLTKFYSFTDELKNSNIVIYNHIVEYELVRIDHALAKKLAFPHGAMFHKLVRLRSAKEYPLMLETTYLPQERFHTIDISFLENRGSLYEYLRNTYGFHVDRAVE
ncbi:MAG: GntR family transcriptional regulator, partial [Lacrimispora sphenoides]